MIADPEGDTDDITFCGVEQLAMEHYKENGYPEGKGWVKIIILEIKIDVTI